MVRCRGRRDLEALEPSHSRPIRHGRRLDRDNHAARFTVRFEEPELERGTWEDIKRAMRRGALDPLVKEMIFVAVSATNNCEYCIHSHTASARAKGMNDEMFAELMAVTGLANETNRLANGFRVPVDDAFRGIPD